MKKVYTIGRDSQNDVVIEDPSDVVSRVHATIRFDGTKMYIIDQSQNGTYVNGMRMEANEEVPVTRKDNVSFANVAELDWKSVPDPQKAVMRSLFLVTGLLMLLALLIFGGLYYLKNKGSDNPSNPQETENVIESEEPDASTDDLPEEVDTLTNVRQDSVKTTIPGNGEQRNGGKNNVVPTPVTEEPKADIPLY